MKKRIAGWIRRTFGRRQVWLEPYPMADLEIVAALSAISDENQQWRAVHELLRRQTIIEREALLVPGLANEAAQYNRGRVAALETYRDLLIQAWVKSRVHE